MLLMMKFHFFEYETEAIYRIDRAFVREELCVTESYISDDVITKHI